MISKFFFKPFVTILVAPVITGIMIHFMFHIRCISIPKLLYFILFPAYFCVIFLSAGIATSISMHIFSFLFLVIISGRFAVTSLSVRTPWFRNSVTSSCSHTGCVCVCVCVCVCTIIIIIIIITISDLIFSLTTVSRNVRLITLFSAYTSRCRVILPNADCPLVPQ
jgi:hypothetical protein